MIPFMKDKWTMCSLSTFSTQSWFSNRDWSQTPLLQYTRVLPGKKKNSKLTLKPDDSLDKKEAMLSGTAILFFLKISERMRQTFFKKLLLTLSQDAANFSCKGPSKFCGCFFFFPVLCCCFFSYNPLKI